MRHILRVLTLISYESPIEHGIFEATDLLEAIECAKVNLCAHNTTIVEAVPFGPRRSAEGTYIGENSPLTVWEHDPDECQKKLGGWAGTHKCEVCEASLQAEREYQERRQREEEEERKRQEEDKALTCDGCGHENPFLAPECAGEPCRAPRDGHPSMCIGRYRKVA